MDLIKCFAIALGYLTSAKIYFLIPDTCQDATNADLRVYRFYQQILCKNENDFYDTITNRYQIVQSTTKSMNGVFRSWIIMFSKW